jgi:hypothetical protein
MLDFFVGVGSPWGRPIWAEARLDAGFRRIQEYFRRWADPGSSLHDAIVMTWLEWDLHALPARKIPSIFFGMKVPPEVGSAGASAAIEAALDPLAERGRARLLAQRLAPVVERCLAFGAEELHVGMMLGRDVEGVRFVAGPIRCADVVALATSLGYPGDPGTLREAIAVIAPFRDQTALNFDIGERLGEVLGLECRFPGALRPNLERYMDFLAHLVERGLSSPSKRDAIIAWPGNVLELRGEPPALGIIAVRYLSHIKVVHQSNRIADVKAYLGFEHEILDGDALEAFLPGRRAPP